MRARELAERFPIVSLSTDALTAARTMGDQRHPGLIVCDGDSRPHTVLPGTQVLRFMIPSYVQDDPALARVYDERGSDELLTKLSNRTVQDLLPRRQDRAELPVVDPDATTLEVAAVMTRMHSPVVAVVDDDGQVLGAVTLSRLF
nr:CBS domain-containing protein [Geodermatophilaceae bacterium]